MAPLPVRYTDDQILSLDMLEDEQDYLRETRARHAHHQHGAGIVAGLELAFPDGAAPVVRPGMGIVSNGADLLLDRETPVALEDGDGPWNIFLCRDGLDPLGRPVGRIGDADTAPRADRLFLGRVERDGSTWRTAAGAPPTRAGLVGETLHAVAGGGAVALTDNVVVQNANGADLIIDGRAIAAPGSLDQTGAADVGAALTFPAGARAATAARPWRMGPAPAAGTAAPTPFHLELPAGGRLVVGRRDADGSFIPLLAVGADGGMDVTGDLRVGGTLVEGPVPPSPDEPRFVAALVDAWKQGAAMGGLGDIGPLTLAFAELTLDTASGRLAGSLILSNRSDRQLDGIAVTLTIVAPGLYQQQRLDFPKPGPLTPSPGRIAAGTQRLLGIAATLPAPLPATPPQLIAAAIFPTADGTIGRVTAVATAPLSKGPQP